MRKVEGGNAGLFSMYPVQIQGESRDSRRSILQINSPSAERVRSQVLVKDPYLALRGKIAHAKSELTNEQNILLL